MNGQTDSANKLGADVVVSSPGNGRLYVHQNTGVNGWSQINMNSDSAGVTAVVVADVDGDGRQDVIAAGASDMKYHLTGGGGITDSSHPGYDGQSWTTHTATSFTGTCEYDSSATCTNNGGTWDAATASCANVPATLECYENSGVRTGGARGWSAPTMIADASVAGVTAQAATAVDASTGVFTTNNPTTAGFRSGDTVQVSDSGGGSCTALAGTYTVTAVSGTALTLADMAGADPSTPSHCLVGRDAKKAIVFASDSNGSASNPGYVGVYQSVGGTC